MSIRIYHNPRCSKSRQTLQLLQDQGQQPEIVEYLKTPPSKQTLQQIIAALGIAPRELLRKGESVYKELGLADKTLSDDALLDAMAEHPILIERPIVVLGSKAAIGRPPENVLTIL